MPPSKCYQQGHIALPRDCFYIPVHCKNIRISTDILWMWARGSLFRRFTDTNEHKTGSVKIWKTCHKISINQTTSVLFLVCATNTVFGPGIPVDYTLRKRQNLAFPVRNYISSILITSSILDIINCKKTLVSSTGHFGKNNLVISSQHIDSHRQIYTCELTDGKPGQGTSLTRLCTFLQQVINVNAIRRNAPRLAKAYNYIDL